MSSLLIVQELLEGTVYLYQVRNLVWCGAPSLQQMGFIGIRHGFSVTYEFVVTPKNDFYAILVQGRNVLL